jgi:hypothetical protein
MKHCTHCQCQSFYGATKIPDTQTVICTTGYNNGKENVCTVSGNNEDFYDIWQKVYYMIKAGFTALKGEKTTDFLFRVIFKTIRLSTGR